MRELVSTKLHTNKTITARAHTPEVYAIELFEFPKAIPMAKLSVAATPSISSIAMLQRLQPSFLYLTDSEVIRSNIICYFWG